MTQLDVEHCREWFPPLANGIAYFDNAGGTYVPRPVIDAMHDFMSNYQCQPAWDFASSRGCATTAQPHRAQRLRARQRAGAALRAR